MKHLRRPTLLEAVYIVAVSLFFAVSPFYDLGEDDDLTAMEHFSRGYDLQLKGEDAEAAEEYSKAIDLDPTLVLAYANRGSILDKYGKYDEAIRDYNRTLEINPKFAGTYYNRGRTYMSLKKYETAILDFDKAIELNPKFAEAYNNRGTSYAMLRKYDLALENFQKAFELNPNNKIFQKNIKLVQKQMQEKSQKNIDPQPKKRSRIFFYAKDHVVFKL